MPQRRHCCSFRVQLQSLIGLGSVCLLILHTFLLGKSPLPLGPSLPLLSDAWKRAPLSREGSPTARQLPSRPPLSELIDVSELEDANPTSSSITRRHIDIVGNVQFLLDYAIIGFSKCGTTTLLKWIRRNTQVRTFKHELHELVNNDPGHLVELLYDNLLNSGSTNNTLQGFKNPDIIQTPLALQHIRTYWPQTKLIVSVRNPMKWFRSFYNFRLTIGQLALVGNNPNALIGGCGGNNNETRVLCTDMGAFHAKLAHLGKTSLATPEEWDLLRPYNSPNSEHLLRQQGRRLPNPIFFLDLRQLADNNKTRAKIFRRDLQQFLGLQDELTPVFRARPFQYLGESLDNQTKSYLMESICHANYISLQKELFQTAQRASLWLRNYFLQSPDVVVSSREYLIELLSTWMENPCEVGATEK